jgi:MFS family permease
LFRGTIVVQIGFAMQQVAMGWLILDLSGSPFFLGLNTFCFAVPMVVVSPFGGVIADRLSRTRVLIVSQSTLLVLSVVLAALVYLEEATVWHLMTTSLLMGTMMAFNVPARQALLPILVGRDLVSNAIAMHSMGLNTSRIIGPALAGFLINAVGAAGCFAVQAIGYLWSIGNVSAIKIGPQESTDKRGSQLHDLLEGLRYCRRTGPVFTTLIIATISSVFVMPIYMTLLPAYARDTLGQDASGLGLLMSAASVGALIGSVGIAIAGRLPARGLIVLGAVIAAGVLLIIASTIRTMAPAMLVLGGLTACSAILMILNQSIIQETVPNELLGRVMSVYLVTWGMMPLGAIPLAAVADSFGTPAAFVIGGTISVGLALAMLVVRSDVRQI